MSTVRMNISLPADLRKRMDGVPMVNWSAVARKAFEDILKRLEVKGEKAA